MKHYLFTCICLCFSIALFAQNTDKPATRAGIKAGYNLAAVTFDNETETGQRSGFHAGIFGEGYINKAVSLQIEVLYSQQGYELTNDSGTFKQKLNYINLPLLLKIYPANSFFIEAGPQIGFAISHKEEFDSNFNLFSTSDEYDPDSFDYGVNFGAGFKTDSGVTFGLRYHLGLGSVYDEGDPKNRVWMFSVGFGL